MINITTRLYETPEALQTFLDSGVRPDCDAVVLFSLGFEPADFAVFAATFAADTPVFLADCYGILGFSSAEGRNIELLEAGRGQEYGGVGGDGGQGVVVAAFSGGGITATTNTLPVEEAVAHMVVAAHGSDINTFLAQHASAVYYGGLAKATFRYSPDQQQFEKVSYFFINSLKNAYTAVGTTSFTADVKGALQALLDQTPAASRTNAVALFPCFMRGKNEYGVNNVEPDAVSELLTDVPVYGMFCHGELGPWQLMGFNSMQSPQQACGLHSMTTIVALHNQQSPMPTA